MKTIQPSPRLEAIQEDLRALGDPEDAAFLQRFFKTGPGEYGEGDRFLGIRVPVLRKLARTHHTLPIADCLELLHCPIHEARLLGLLILGRAYERGDESLREAIYTLYLDNTTYVNNWDLVDASAAQIVGRHLQDGDTSVLSRLARSELLWDRRIAIIATFHFIKAGAFDGTLQIAALLLRDEHDLIHKAVGWMLREVGKRDHEVAERFLRTHYRQMPRTMLRYAIERFPSGLRQRFLRGEV